MIALSHATLGLISVVIITYYIQKVQFAREFSEHLPRKRSIRVGYLFFAVCANFFHHAGEVVFCDQPI